jgi:hypothetical protein
MMPLRALATDLGVHASCDAATDCCVLEPRFAALPTISRQRSTPTAALSTPRCPLTGAPPAPWPHSPTPPPWALSP